MAAKAVSGIPRHMPSTFTSFLGHPPHSRISQGSAQGTRQVTGSQNLFSGFSTSQVHAMESVPSTLFLLLCSWVYFLYVELGDTYPVLLCCSAFKTTKQGNNLEFIDVQLASFLLSRQWAQGSLY
jgi:hypothetical protein